MFFLLPPVPATLFGPASYFPIELCAEIGRQCALRLRAAREIRITSRRGTDFRALLDPRNCTADPGGWLEAWGPGRVIGRTPGEGSNTFPPGVVLAYPDPRSVEGVAVFEHHVGVGPVASHLAVRYEYGRTVGAQGEGAEKLASIVDGVELRDRRRRARVGHEPAPDADAGHGAQSDRRRAARRNRPRRHGALADLRQPDDEPAAPRRADHQAVDLPRRRADHDRRSPARPRPARGARARRAVRRPRRAAARALPDHTRLDGGGVGVGRGRARQRVGDAGATVARAASGRALGRPLGPPARAADRARRGDRADGGRALRARALPLQRGARDAGGRDLPRRDRPRPHRGRVRARRRANG